MASATCWAVSRARKKSELHIATRFPANCWHTSCPARLACACPASDRPCCTVLMLGSDEIMPSTLAKLCPCRNTKYCMLSLGSSSKALLLLLMLRSAMFDLDWNLNSNLDGNGNGTTNASPSVRQKITATAAAIM
eukprot:scaffold39546_cov62-Attheya_sp.AAC.2